MTVQINLKLEDEFLEMSKIYAKKHGFLSVQELIRESLREKLFDELELRPEYVKKLMSKEANTFLSDDEADELDKDLERRAKLR